MRRKLTAFLSLLLALLLAVSPFTAGAVYLTGEKVADYTVLDSETHTLADGLV